MNVECLVTNGTSVSHVWRSGLRAHLRRGSGKIVRGSQLSSIEKRDTHESLTVKHPLPSSGGLTTELSVAISCMS